ncbi:MAG: hypothetical protein LBT25_09340, partial [Candidatus Symbiothrix sp.]|nr:hypothetical protein [Candidatus Symbiothrix sp.]
GIYENVEIWGTSGTPGDPQKYYPKLSYATTPQASSYVIKPEGTASGLRNKSGAYSNPNGIMHVRFDYAVDSIYIKYTLTGTPSSNAGTGIGIGPITFSCPIVMPPVNEAGLSLLKEAPDSISLCKEVTFTYRIYNANCDPKLVNFNDTLPTGLSWVPNSLSVDAASQSGTYAVNAYGGSVKALKITDLIALGGTTTTFTIKATFDDNALGGKYNTGYADIAYRYFKDGVEIDGALQSCDRFLGCGSETFIVATGSPADRYKPIITSIIGPSCFSPNEVLTFKINVSNLNLTTFSNVALNIDFTDSLTLVPPITSDLTLGTLIQNSLVSYSFEGFSIPQDVGTDPYTITFKVKVPAKAHLKHVWVDTGNVDADGNPIFEETDEIEDLAVDFEFRSESPDDCQQAAFTNASGIKELPLCGSKFNIIINKNITVPKKRL